MHVLQVTSSLDVTFGGTANATAHLAGALARAGHQVSMIVLEDARAGTEWTVDRRVDIRRCALAAPRRLGYAPAMDRTIASFPRPDVLHVHGLWRMAFDQAARSVRPMGVPIVVSVHGMLHDHAVSQHAAGKRLAAWLYQDALLRRATALHATADEEREAIRQKGLAAPVAVIPWGVDAPDAARASAAPSVRRTVLYLGRLHPGKGVDVLIRAWKRAQPGPEWTLAIAGASENGYAERLRALAADLGVADHVSFPGPRVGEAREALFDASAVAVLPSPSENFGLFVAEALARGIPAIATHGAPWRTLDELRCGWWVEADEAALAAALGTACGASDAERQAAGERGRLFVRRAYDWTRVADEMSALYEWTAGRAPEPPALQR